MKLHKPPWILKEFKLEVTYKCPLACLHCSSDATPQNKLQMTKTKCLELIDDAVSIGANTVAFSGGEPLLWEHIDDAITYAGNKNLYVELYTSGNTKSFEETIDRLKMKKLRKVIFSLHGSNTITHEKVTRVSGSYNKTLEAIKHVSKVGLQAELHFVPFLFNYCELPSLANVASVLGVSRISILRFVSQGRGQLMAQFLMDKNSNIELKRIIENLRSSGLDIRTGSPYNFLLLNDQPKCCAGIDRLCIGPDLRIVPCDAFKQVRAEEICGSLDYSTVKNYTLKECWSKSAYLERIRTYLTTDFNDPCSSCINLEVCLSGCLAQKFIAYNNLDKRPDPMCLLTNY